MPEESTQRRHFHWKMAILLILLVAVLATRTLPLAISEYPFNNDSLTECEMAKDILATGHLEFSENRSYSDTRSTVTPIYDLLLAFVSSYLGLSPYDIAQVTVAFISVVAVLLGYVIALNLTGCHKSAILAALVLTLFGTLVFLTGSAWKGALGFALLTMFFFAYTHRRQKSMLAIEVIVLALLPVVHHLAMAIGYLALSYLTVLHVAFVLKLKTESKRQCVIDIAVLTVLSIAALAYYRNESLDRLSLIFTGEGPLNLLIPFIILVGITALLLTNGKARVRRITLAPVAAVAVFLFFALERAGAMFSYDPEGPDYLFLLAFGTSVVVFGAWYGFERVQSSKSSFKAIPFAMFLPVLTLLLFAILGGMNLQAHQILYRSFDYADIALAVGVAFGAKRIKNSPKLGPAFFGAVLCAVILTFPFGYASGALVGVRHDTQDYEVDALAWLRESCEPDAGLMTGERLSYIAMAMFNFEKEPYLPESLTNGGRLPINWYYMLEEEWTTRGVNDYPRGHPVVDAEWLERTLMSSNVYYVGGPSSNSAILFDSSLEGYDQVFG